jgi:ribosomal protein L19E
MSKKPQLSILRQHEQTIEKLQDENQEMFGEIEGLKRDNKKLKEQVSRGEIFRLREKIRVIEQKNKSYVLELRKEIEELKEEVMVSSAQYQQLYQKSKVVRFNHHQGGNQLLVAEIEELKKENEELKLYKDGKKSLWLHSPATIELKKDLETLTRSRDKWRTIAKEEGDEIDALQKAIRSSQLTLNPKIN